MDLDELPFRLVGMTRQELMDQLYADLPSDDGSENDSELDEQSTDSPVLNSDTVIDNEIELSGSESESDVLPLSIVAERLAKSVPISGNSQPIPRKSPIWNKTNTTEPSLPFTENNNLPDFVSELTCPIELFSLFISEDIVEDIVYQTNLYAQQQYKKSGRIYKPTTAMEIRAFIGINLLMGIKKMPSYRDPWSSAPDLHDSYISKMMDVNRFGWLLSNIHLNDNETMPKRGEAGFDKLYKVKPFLEKIQQSFLNCFNPSEIMAIDESMIKFKGRHSLKQYLPKKPIKRGYKVWVLADKTGYCYKFNIYTGKVGDTVQKALGENVVKNMCQGLEQKNHKIFFDNYFSSVKLMEDLKNDKFFSCATINPSRRELPILKSDKTMNRGDYDYSVSNFHISFVKWKDNRSVHLISNYHDPKQTATVKRRNKSGEKQDVPCPIVLVDYNQHMNCVDKLDQLKSTYELDRKSHK